MSKPKIIITIDTEVGEKAKFVKDGFEKFILGKIGEEYWGIPKIVEILNTYGIKGEFFVDVYEDAFFGEENYAKLCQYLNENGHGVQLHTHPSYAYDINRINMHEYSLDEQIRIIGEGKERIIKWIGKAPIAHRAGNYGANNDTLLALKANKIPIDSSFYFGHPNCKMRLATVNDPIYFEQILEIPVSVDVQFKNLFYFFQIFQKYPRKFDINIMDEQNFEDSIKKFKSLYFIIFLHSSSFLKRNNELNSISDINYDSFEIFSNILKQFIKNKYSTIKFSHIMNYLA